MLNQKQPWQSDLFKQGGKNATEALRTTKNKPDAEHKSQEPFVESTDDLQPSDYKVNDRAAE